MPKNPYARSENKKVNIDANRSWIALSLEPPDWFMNAKCDLSEKDKKFVFEAIIKDVDRSMRNCLSLIAICLVVLAVLVLRYNPYISMAIFLGTGIIIILSLFFRRRFYLLTLRRRYAVLYRSVAIGGN